MADGDAGPSCSPSRARGPANLAQGAALGDGRAWRRCADRANLRVSFSFRFLWSESVLSAAFAYLDGLNDQQRRAVEHGIAAADTTPGPPLLVIAGAGSGKTNTLAHRVAHLLMNGADPHRILLMTFSRRAASEMIRRVERIGRKVMGDKAHALTEALTWAGTFHGVGARILREQAEAIGLDPTFTIHDREDAADLMNLIRHQLGYSKTADRFPTKGTCLSIYSR